MLRVFPVLSAIPLLLAAGFTEGLWSGRWQRSNATEWAAARLDDVPLRVGAWEGRSQALDQRQVAAAKLDGHLLREYVNRRTGSTFSVLIVCGRPGPIAIHTPDVCYRGAGYLLSGDPVRHLVAETSPGQPAHFWAGRFQKTGAAIPERLRIWWAWSDDGSWQAPDNPRFDFAGSPSLYKLYVIRQLSGENEATEEDQNFLRVFLPEVQHALFPGS